MKNMKIKIFDEDWTVYITSSVCAGLIANGDPCLGTCWNDKGEIYLSEMLHGLKAKKVIRHELAHAFIGVTQANNPKEWTEEAMCDFIGIYGKQISEIGDVIYNELYKEE